VLKFSRLYEDFARQKGVKLKRKLVTKVITIFDKTVDALAFSAGVILVLMWIIICAEVVLRFLFSYSIIWAVEVNEFSLMVITFIGAAWLLKIEGHIKVDIVYTVLCARAQAFINIVTSIIGAIICVFLLKYGILVSMEHFQDGVVSFTVMRFPTWPRYTLISLGSLLLFIQFLRRAHSNMILWKSGGKKVPNLRQSRRHENVKCSKPLKR
jgi:TRAP-type C4-dicarboxylate transport system permease small subunit